MRIYSICMKSSMLFQSTLSVWRATIPMRRSKCGATDFNPRSPCGERPQRVGRQFSSMRNFNPRSPCGERHFLVPRYWRRCYISIHALRVESDKQALSKAAHGHHFNPRSPCGERLGVSLETIDSAMISIHALRVESDSAARLNLASDKQFQSTLSVWRAT